MGYLYSIKHNTKPDHNNRIGLRFFFSLIPKICSLVPSRYFYLCSTITMYSFKGCYYSHKTIIRKTSLCSLNSAHIIRSFTKISLYNTALYTIVSNRLHFSVKPYKRTRGCSAKYQRKYRQHITTIYLQNGTYI